MESPQDYYTSFQAARAGQGDLDITTYYTETTLNPSQDQIAQTAQDIQTERKKLNGATSFLPAYDRWSYESQLQELEAQIDVLRSKSRSGPAKGSFAFKKKAPSASPKQATDSSTTKPGTKPVITEPPVQVTQTIPAVSLQIASLSHRCFALSLLPDSASSITGTDLTITSLDHCIVDLLPAVEDENNDRLRPRALHIRDVKNSVLILGYVQGSILAHNLERCVIVAACHQLRVHSSSHTRFYLHVSSNAIIEDCTNLTFAPYPENLHLDADVRRMKSAHTNIQDFSHLRSTPSPNWSAISEPSDAEGGEDTWNWDEIQALANGSILQEAEKNDTQASHMSSNGSFSLDIRPRYNGINLVTVLCYFLGTAFASTSSDAETLPVPNDSLTSRTFASLEAPYDYPLFPNLPAMSNREGDKYRALENYVSTNFPESHVSWSEGDPTIRGSEYQAHVVHYGSRIVKNSKGLWMQTLNGSTLEQAADNLLRLLQQREATGMEDLKDYVKEEGYDGKGFIVEVEGPVRSDRLYKVSVHLSIDFCRKTRRNRFVLGVAVRKSTGIAAREVLELLKFKKKNGFMWVDDTFIKEASIKYAREAESDALLKKQNDLRRRGKDLSPHEISKLDQNKLVPQVTWLGRNFKGPPDFYTGQLPELGKELHKALKANGYVLDPVEEKKATIKGKETAPPKPLLAYEAVEAFERIYREKAEKKAEAKENSKISNLSKRLGLK
ncbi:hypothetical protein ACEPAF_2662 [Sanghuangporus sanghuang]